MTRVVARSALAAGAWLALTAAVGAGFNSLQAQPSRIPRVPVVRYDVDLRTPPRPPCCTVTAVDLTTGVMSARDEKSGITFDFAVITLSGSDSAKLVRGVTAGQKIWADLNGKGVFVVYGTICCGILRERSP